MLKSGKAKVACMPVARTWTGFIKARTIGSRSFQQPNVCSRTIVLDSIIIIIIIIIIGTPHATRHFYSTACRPAFSSCRRILKVFWADLNAASN